MTDSIILFCSHQGTPAMKSLKSLAGITLEIVHGPCTTPGHQDTMQDFLPSVLLMVKRYRHPYCFSLCWNKR